MGNFMYFSLLRHAEKNRNLVIELKDYTLSSNHSTLNTNTLMMFVMVLRILKKANTTCAAFRPKLQRPNDTPNEFRIVISSWRRMGRKLMTIVILKETALS
ncbi:hypothetical protein NPIL_612761 [Nephila pilipes]|uniref:Uncharacterized protein n=1 Tax=Nephila pilipes TaxID=299642 RepID=A0A8X6PLW9_NEPPI|nr:hypothetical protein NPIL_612761 [Nephila pilipes]